MIDKQKYLDILSFAELTSTRINLLSDVVALADPTHPFNATFINMFENIESIEAWAQSYIDQAIQEEQNAVMNNFLAELKLVFDKYAASISTASFEDGYGIGYGEPGTGFVLTARLDNVTSTKEIRKAAINSEDLI